jgi:hypothetical protein
MSVLSERRSRPLFRPESPPAPLPPEPARRLGWWRYVAALLLGGYLLFAHGCHGDEDNELFAAGKHLFGEPGALAPGGAAYAKLGQPLRGLTPPARRKGARL